MIYSMTGYGKATAQINGKKMSVEIRTLNSKSFDLNLKYPPLYREKEAELRNLIAEKLDRGKIDFWMTIEDMGESGSYEINQQLVKGYFRQIQQISNDLQTEPGDILGMVLRMPEVVKPAEDTVNEDDWKAIYAIACDALDTTMRFRRKEGDSLLQALEGHVSAIETNLELIQNYESGRVVRLREKMEKGLKDLIAENEVDKNRFEQELIYYLEKLDISEEKVRLRTHCAYFLETLRAEGINGKKLNFISQEMGREINTLGSKAYEANIQKHVVLMKDELEKIKEQVLNVL